MKLLLNYIVLLLIPLISFGQSSDIDQRDPKNKFTISGHVTDEEDGEALIGVSVFDIKSGKGTVTNFYGFYSLTLGSDSVKLLYNYIGYATIKKEFKLESDQKISIDLNSKSTQLEVVEIVAVSEVEDINSTQMSAIKITPKEIANIPAIGGEVDLIKVVQLMPGIQKGSEGGTGMYVRGGGSDQNLIILDEATVYNVGHLFGFFSVFNNDAIKDVTVIKGGFPAYYGGRLSSVLDIRLKEGNTRKFHADGGVGLLSSRLTLQGPIKKDKMSFILSGRRTYIDQVFKLVGLQIPYYFYDLNSKVNYKISDKDRLYFSSYFGNDVLYFNDSDEKSNDLLNAGFTLGNFTSTLRWNRIYNSKLFSNISLIHTRFKYDIEGKFQENSLFISSNIQDYALKADFDYFHDPENHIKYGMVYTNHNFRPNLVSTRGEISNVLKSRSKIFIPTHEVGMYASNDMEINKLWKLNYGLRTTGVYVQGTFYGGWEPRLSTKYSLSEKSSIKASYSRMRQYMHLVSSSSVALPTDLWYPVTENVKPQISDQIAAGYFYRFDKLNAIGSVEAYYKWMKNIIEYREGASLILNDNFDDELLSGNGDAYGMEFLLKKNSGKLTGWTGYTVSWATRDFDELNKDEQNIGMRYFAKYDRRHDYSIVLMYELGKRWDFSTVWVYSTGSRFTARVGDFFMPNASLTNVDVLPIYTDKNAVVLSSSHRLDLNFIRSSKPDAKWHREWHIGCYNFYARATPYRIEIVPSDKSEGFKYQQRGLFGFIFNLAYNFSF
ncbi:MAG: TonB-dependent receptor [Bacteroidia bacterium]|nr:TonB-dependent receptor [Bacteroidia bacterium]